MPASADRLLTVGQAAELLATSERFPRRLIAEPLANASAWIEDFRRFWDESFQRLDGLLEEMKAQEKTQAGPKKKGRSR